MIELLKSNSIEVTRQGSDYLAIKLPDSKKAKRFKQKAMNISLEENNLRDKLEFAKRLKLNLPMIISI